MNVLVVPEDFRKDQYLLKPLISKMFDHLARPASVRVCQDPLLGGIVQALKWERIEEIIRIYPDVQLFILCVDRDGDLGRRARLDELEKLALGAARESQHLIAVEAWQEIEVWGLAGMKDLPKDWRWADIRAEAHSKEAYFDVYIRSRGLARGPDGGRKIVGREAAANYRSVVQHCAEFRSLEQRIQERANIR